MGGSGHARDREGIEVTIFQGWAKNFYTADGIRKISRIGILIFPILVLPYTASAFVPLIHNQEPRSTAEEHSRGDEWGGVSHPVDAWIDFVGKYGGRWKVDWDEERGTLRALYGSSIEIFPGGLPDGELLADRLLSFVDENHALFGIVSSDLRSIDAARHGRLWYVDFQQMAGSVPIYGGRVQFKLRSDGSLVSVSSRIFRGTGPVASPTVTLEQAEREARRYASFVEGQDHLGEARLVLYPLPEDREKTLIFSWIVDLITRDPPAHWFIVINARTGDVIDRWNQIYYGSSALDSIFGRVRGAILPGTPTDLPEEHPFKDMEVELSSGGTDITDATGFFLIESGSPDPDSIMAAMFGSFVDVENDSGPDAALRMEALVGSPNEVIWDDANSVPSERNGFYHTVLVHDYVKMIDSSFDGLDYPMPCRVNIDQTCNAFWDGLAINFFRAGSGCANTANIADVIYHEYGHGLTDFQYRPFPQPSGDMHEGFSDYLAATVTNQSLIGRGFFGPGTWLRNTENSRVYPAPECGGEPHCVGEAIAGALWDMRQNLIGSFGQGAGVALADSLFHYARYGHSILFPDYFIDILLVDDDDGDLSNGIPHAEEICEGFENHGLSCVLTPNEPVVFDVGTGSELQVVWQAVPSLLAPIIEYRVFFGQESGSYTDSLSTGADTTVVVSGLQEGHLYYFSLSAIDSTGRTSLLSQEGTGVPFSIPLPPEGVITVSRPDEIELTWTRNRELDIDSYVVQRSIDADSGFAGLAIVEENDTTYVDASPVPHVMYYYRIAARDNEGMDGDPSDVVRGRFMSLDSGILIVDGTRDGIDGLPYSWSDSTVDRFYSELLAEYPVATEYDISDSLTASRFPLDTAIMGLYSTVVWHQDDRTSPSMVPALDDLAVYLSQGGNLLLSGWKLIRHLSGGDIGSVVFPPGSIPHDFLKLNATESLSSAAQDFAGSDPLVAGYPGLPVDSTKALLFGGNLFEMDLLFEPFVDEPVTEPVYAYASSAGDTATTHGEVVGIRYLGSDYGLILFDFPLFYMERPAADLAIARAMSDLGEAVGIAGGEGDGIFIPRVFALHQNYPNPFNPSTSIVIDIAAGAQGREGADVRARVTIFNLRGQRMRILLDEDRKPGRYLLKWDGRDERGESVGSGVYFYRMVAGDFTSTRKMLLLK